MAKVSKEVGILGLVMCFASVIARSGDHTFLSPGLKLGYTFGQSGGFTYGAELSYVVWSKESFVYGAVLDIDRCRTITKVHLGGEFGTFAGIDVGPTMIWDSNIRDTDIGFSVIPYFGAIIPYVYYDFTYRPERETSINELGLYMKLPVSLGEPFRWMD